MPRTNPDVAGAANSNGAAALATAAPGKVSAA